MIDSEHPLIYDIGRDILSQYFYVYNEDAYNKTETFRKNSNHIAHNILIDKCTYDIIKKYVATVRL